MRAVVWHGTEDVRVEQVPDPVLQEPTDAIDEILPLVLDDADPLGTEDFATHRLPLDEAPHAYELYQEKRDGAIKIVLTP